MPWPQVGDAGFRPLSLPRLPEAPEPEAEEILRGEFRPFHASARNVGLPPEWSRNILTGEVIPSDRHWSEIGDFGGGDIKGVWELSRWPWAYPLGRAYLRNKDERYTRAFVDLALDWMDRNPPNIGPNWKCGQEASIRLMAAAWALSAFQGSPLLTEAVRARFASLAQVTATRVESHLSYALSQDNNHGISEVVGMLTAGCLWPGLSRAGRWVRKARGKLSGSCNRLFAADGSFSQHSSNYHRVALDGLCWAAVVSNASGVALPPAVMNAGQRGSTFLWHILDPAGGTFRYGSDDGAYIMPLTGLPYGDFRPTLAACATLFSSPSLGPGPWNDQARLLGLEPDQKPPVAAQTAVDLPFGGVHIRRGKGWALFLRCPTHFRFRPSQADQLHVSIWKNGRYVTEDPGTLSYNQPGRPWASLSSARFHNVPMVDGLDPMQKITRFLWMPWTPCSIERCDERTLIFSHEGFPGFNVRREVRILEGEIVIEDRIDGDRDVTLSVRWNSPSRPGLEEISVSSTHRSPVESWHHGEFSTGLGIHCQRYGHPGESWCRIVSANSRHATFTSRVQIPNQ